MEYAPPRFLVADEKELSKTPASDTVDLHAVVDYRHQRSARPDESQAITRSHFSVKYRQSGAPCKWQLAGDARDHRVTGCKYSKCKRNGRAANAKRGNTTSNGADPKTVPEPLGHKTLAMTMNLDTKIASINKQQAVAGLTCGASSLVSESVLELVTP